MENSEKININLGENSLFINGLECTIVLNHEIVDEKSIHVSTNKGVFLLNVDNVTINGEDVIDIDDLVAKIPFNTN